MRTTQKAAWKQAKKNTINAQGIKFFLNVLNHYVSRKSIHILARGCNKNIIVDLFARLGRPQQLAIWLAILT